MRKSQVLVVAVALLFCSAVAVQAQGIYEVVGVAKTAREGGGAELAGSVVLFLRTGDAGSGTITVEYSADLAEGTSAMVRRGGTTATAVAIAADMIDEDENTVMVDLSEAGGDTGSNVYTIMDVRLDVREATVPVMATVSGDGNAIVSGVVEVITGIENGVTLESKASSVLTRGSLEQKLNTVTVKEGFRSAWAADSQVMLTVSGVPKDATWGVWHLQTLDTTAGAPEGQLAMAGTGGTVTLAYGMEDITLVANDGRINAGDADGALMDQKADGKDIELTITLSDTPMAGVESLVLEFGVNTATMGVDEGMVSVVATMAPDEAAGDNPEFFDATPTDAATLFTFDPATCTLLFPYAASLPEASWNTAIAVTNPTAGAGSALSGALTFTLFMNGAEEPMMIESVGPMMAGTGLNDEGMLEAGNTYTVLLSELLPEEHEGDFIGHFYVKTDFTGCRGVGWITNWTTVNQAYLPYFEDNRDIGNVPGGSGSN